MSALSSHFPFFLYRNKGRYCIDLNPVGVSAPVALDLAKYEGFFAKNHWGNQKSQ